MPRQKAEKVNPKGSGGSQAKPPTGKVSKFNLEDWVSTQRTTYGSREGLKDYLEREASRFDTENRAIYEKYRLQFAEGKKMRESLGFGSFVLDPQSNPLGLSGALLDCLIHETPRMIPRCFWGAERGWRSPRRNSKWQSLLEYNGIKVLPFHQGTLIRFLIDPTEWIPHPYIPPLWAVSHFGLFSEYIVSSKAAFDLCRQWDIENTRTLTQLIEERVKELPVQVGARYFCHDRKDYADVAFLLLPSMTKVLQVQTIWRSEKALADLVISLFPNAHREFSPPWLNGQRLDIFIPSLKVAIEYQGEQHYEAIEYFGGHEGLLKNQARDLKKAEACRNAGIVLIEWKYDEPINEANLQKKIKAVNRGRVSRNKGHKQG